MDYFHKGDDRRQRIINHTQIRDDSLAHLFVLRHERFDPLDGTVRQVADFKERRDVDPVDAREFLEQRILVTPPFLPLFDYLDNLDDHLFTIPETEAIKEFRKRLRVEGARSAADDQGHVSTSLPRARGYLRQREDIEDIRITELVL